MKLTRIQFETLVDLIDSKESLYQLIILHQNFNI